MTQASDIRACLQAGQTIAVVGLSPKTHRDSYRVSQYMQSHGYRIVPVNPRYAGTPEGILGERCYASLLDIPHPVDMVDVFRRSTDVLPIAQQAIEIGARCVWHQLDVENQEADVLARAHGLSSVMNRCVKIEHARLFGGLHWMGVNTGIISAQRPH